LRPVAIVDHVMIVDFQAADFARSRIYLNHVCR